MYLDFLSSIKAKTISGTTICGVNMCGSGSATIGNNIIFKTGSTRCVSFGGVISCEANGTNLVIRGNSANKGATIDDVYGGDVRISGGTAGIACSAVIIVGGSRDNVGELTAGNVTICAGKVADNGGAVILNSGSDGVTYICSSSVDATINATQILSYRNIVTTGAGTYVQACCIKGTTCVCSPIVCASSCVRSPLISGTTAIFGGFAYSALYASGVSANGPINTQSYLKAGYYGGGKTSLHLNWDAADNYGFGSDVSNVVKLEGANTTSVGRGFNGNPVDFRVTGCVSGSTMVSSPIVCASSCVRSPLISGTSVVTGSVCIKAPSAGSGNLSLLAPAGSTDSGDIVFYTGATTTASEWARIWTDSSTGCFLYRSACDNLTNRCVWHSGNFSGGGLAWTGSTADGIGTYSSSGTICSEPNLTFDGSILCLAGNFAFNCAATRCITMGNAITGGTAYDLNICGESFYKASGTATAKGIILWGGNVSGTTCVYPGDVSLYGGYGRTSTANYGVSGGNVRLVGGCGCGKSPDIAPIQGGNVMLCGGGAIAISGVSTGGNAMLIGGAITANCVSNYGGGAYIYGGNSTYGLGGNVFIQGGTGGVCNGVVNISSSRCICMNDTTTFACNICFYSTAGNGVRCVTMGTTTGTAYALNICGNSICHTSAGASTAGAANFMAGSATGLTCAGGGTVFLCSGKACITSNPVTTSAIGGSFNICAGDAYGLCGQTPDRYVSAGGLTLTGGRGTVLSGSTRGGDVTIYGGCAVGTSSDTTGGHVCAIAGSGWGCGGNVCFWGGAANCLCNGGLVAFIGGCSKQKCGGDVRFGGGVGSCTGNKGGDICFTAGCGCCGANGGNVIICAGGSTSSTAGCVIISGNVCIDGYAPQQTAGYSISTLGWTRIATVTNYMSYGTITITNNYNNYPPSPITFNFGTTYRAAGFITQIGGNNSMFSKARIVYATTADTNYYIEVYYSQSLGNTYYITLSNSVNATLIGSYTAGSIPASYGSNELTFTNGVSTIGNMVATGSYCSLTTGCGILLTRNTSSILMKTLYFCNATDNGVGDDVWLTNQGGGNVFLKANGNIGLQITSTGAVCAPVCVCSPTVCAGTTLYGGGGCSSFDSSNFVMKDSGTADSTAVRFFSAAGNLYLQNGSGNYIIFRSKTGGQTACLDNTGILCVAACGVSVDWIATSDSRLKTDILPIQNALSTVMNLQGVCYHKCDDETCEMHLGLIAQDVQKVLPEVVSHGKPNEDDFKYGICDDKLGLKYDKLSAVLIEAIKEQQLQIKEQQKQLHCLCLELNYMRNSNT